MRRLALIAIVIFIAPLARAEDQVTAPAASASTSVEVGHESPAEARARKLDQLLGKLHTQADPASAAAIEAQVWEIWSRNDSPTAEVLLRQSSAAIASGDFEPAEKMLSQLLETYPNYAEGWNRRASLYYLMKRYDVAMIDIDHALAIEPRNFGALVGKGMILRATGNGEAALALFREALAINPHLPAVKAAIAQIEKDEPHI